MPVMGIGRDTDSVNLPGRLVLIPCCFAMGALQGKIDSRSMGWEDRESDFEFCFVEVGRYTVEILVASGEWILMLKRDYVGISMHWVKHLQFSSQLLLYARRATHLSLFLSMLLSPSCQRANVEFHSTSELSGLVKLSKFTEMSRRILI
ncbi:hypothetical protein SASPL_110822 [Salvia splendens]|uniref:Uncharacterized protein n=1 Tax=Salvia splendens TaxID=180675 RepID=A0A8X9A3P8_SALSN|nr:hypothetical protein SASPL_110822 [Salvia splendens]